MSERLGDAVLELKTRDKDFSRGVDSAKSKAGELENQLDDVGQTAQRMGIAMRVAIMAAVAALAVAVIAAKKIQGEAAKLAKRLEDVSRQAEALGASTQSIQELQHTFAEFGLTGNAVADVLSTLADRARAAQDGTKSFVDDFALLGIKVDDLRGKRPEELLALIADGAASIEDPTRRAAALVGIFGQSLGRRLNPLLREGSRGLEEYARRWHEAGLIIDDEGVEAGRRAAETFRELGRNVTALKDNLVLELIPAVDAVARGLNSLFFPTDAERQLERLRSIREEIEKLNRTIDFVGGNRVLERRRNELRKELITLLRQISEANAAIAAAAAGDAARPTEPITDIAGPAPRPAPVTVRLGGTSDRPEPLLPEQIAEVARQLEGLEIQALQAQGRAGEAIRLAADQQIEEWRRVAEETPALAEQAATAIGLINQRAVADIANLTEETAHVFEEFGRAIRFSIEDNLTAALLKIRSFGDAARSILNTIAEAFIRFGISQVTSGLFGAAGLFPIPGFQSGGRPTGPSIVGERGPELFMPDRSGTIIPNHELGGMGGLRQEFNFPISFPAQLEAFIRNVAGPAGRDAALQVGNAQRGRF